MDTIQNYTPVDHMLTSLHTFSGLIYSMFVSDIYGLIRRILCLIFIGPHCKVTMILVQHCVITNVPLYGVSYLYADLLVTMTLSLTL